MPTLKKLVLDSSVIIKWLNKKNEQYLAQANKLLDELELGTIEVSVPHLVKFEVANALLKGKRLLSEEAAFALDSFNKLPLQYFDFDLSLLRECYKIAEKQNITFYDASFIALAKHLNATLITDNPKHQKKFVNVNIISLEDYHR